MVRESLSAKVGGQCDAIARSAILVGPPLKVWAGQCQLVNVLVVLTGRQVSDFTWSAGTHMLLTSYVSGGRPFH